MTAKVIDLIFRAYIKQAQAFSFVAESEPVNFDDIKFGGDCARLTETYLVGQVWFTPRLIKVIESKMTIDEAVKRGIADVPTELENRLICLELAKSFDLSLCPQFKDGLLQIEKRKDYLMPVKVGGLITGLRFEFLPTKRVKVNATV